jgi:hypothetical protein
VVYHFAVSLGLTRFSRLPPKQTSEKFGDNSKKRVERALGVELFIRTTRQLRRSSAGERYIPQCR